LAACASNIVLGSTVQYISTGRTAIRANGNLEVATIWCSTSCIRDFRVEFYSKEAIFLLTNQVAVHAESAPRLPASDRLGTGVSAPGSRLCGGQGPRALPAAHLECFRLQQHMPVLPCSRVRVCARVCACWCTDVCCMPSFSIRGYGDSLVLQV
jgi:hypothetical protein